MSVHLVPRLRVSSIAVYIAALATLASAQAPARVGSASKGSPQIGAGIPVVENYTTKDYNGFGQVWTAAQDKQGLMYFGVSGGTVLQFDGVTWRKIYLASNIVRSLAADDNGRIWVGSNGTFGYLDPDATGTMQYVSLVDQIPQADRGFTDVWQTLPTPDGTYFRTFEHLFRWDGSRMQVWSAAPNSRFQGLSQVRGRVYIDQEGIGLGEIVGDDIRNVPGGDGYKNSIKLFLYPYDDTRIIVSERNGLLSLYDGRRSRHSVRARTII